jgi:hypothetical protein
MLDFVAIERMVIGGMRERDATDGLAMINSRVESRAALYFVV